MPVVGDLRRMGLLRLLEMLSVGRRSGLIQVRGGKDRLDIYLRKGRCEHVQTTSSSPPTEDLLSRLVADADNRQEIRKLTADDELGTVLLLDFLGLSSRERSLATVREQATVSLHRANDWQKGDFRFEPAVEPPKGRLSLGLPFSRVRQGTGVPARSEPW